jgi:hypothetical protein
LPCPAEVAYWSETNGVVLTEAKLQAWEKIAKEYNLKNDSIENKESEFLKLW